ncbi:hypothetical protein E2C01_091628 [Portunus trituberculatus]|uniref:Uncharacterized protein n=1 Tax=Portunus trituberculatus TaxID=210409 RepID=A0A5B7JEF6_PORTR|nr:hypothetical protein [Portunus trituberculatus]
MEERVTVPSYHYSLLPVNWSVSLWQRVLYFTFLLFLFIACRLSYSVTCAPPQCCPGPQCCLTLLEGRLPDRGQLTSFPPLPVKQDDGGGNSWLKASPIVFGVV